VEEPAPHPLDAVADQVVVEVTKTWSWWDAQQLGRTGWPNEDEDEDEEDEEDD
jgi:hypothetical protein